MRIFGLLLLAVECLLSVAAHSEDLPKRLPTGFYTDIPPYLREILIKSSNLSGPDYIPYINSIPEATKAELRKYLAAEVKLDPENYDGLRFDLRDEEVVSRWINNFERTGDFGNMDVHGRPDIITPARKQVAIRRHSAHTGFGSKNQHVLVTCSSGASGRPDWFRVVGGRVVGVYCPMRLSSRH